MFSIIKKGIIIFPAVCTIWCIPLVLVFISLLTVQVHADETKTSSVSVEQAGNTQVESGQIQLSSEADKLKGISAGLGTSRFRQGQISITEPRTQSPEPRQKGVSISRSGKGMSGSVASSKSISQPKNMTKIQNMGKQGKITKAQSIKKFSKDVESNELNQFEQKRLKRKENFKKTLKKRRAQKALTKDQQNGEE